VDTPPFFSHYSGFAGVGAFALAFKYLGGLCRGGFDSDAAVAKIFAAENPSARVDGDLRLIDVASLPACDIYGGGAPCQSYSVAGQKGGKEERGLLMFEQLEYLRHHRPVLGVFEQVPNFQQMHGGAFMLEFVGALESLGYVVAPDT
jgi:DNA (cytosine-5)-methyltransferase 1